MWTKKRPTHFSTRKKSISWWSVFFPVQNFLWQAAMHSNTTNDISHSLTRTKPVIFAWNDLCGVVWNFTFVQRKKKRKKKQRPPYQTKCCSERIKLSLSAIGKYDALVLHTADMLFECKRHYLFRYLPMKNISLRLVNWLNKTDLWL